MSGRFLKTNVCVAFCSSYKRNEILIQNATAREQQNLLRKNLNSTNQTMQISMATALPILVLGLLCLLSMASSQQSLPNSCTCKFDQKFKGCLIRDSEEAWREHYDDEVGLNGDCLPQVPENTMQCFKWRFNDDCGENHDTLRCSLRALDQTTIQGSSATIVSPGFHRKNPGYNNRRLCIYNISLDCASNLVELVPTSRTTSLSDAQSCRDYLSFHVDSQSAPVTKLCGQDVGDVTKYRDIHSNSFYGVLWSNSQSNMGMFEITARCKDTPEQGSGDDEGVVPTTTVL